MTYKTHAIHNIIFDLFVVYPGRFLNTIELYSKTTINPVKRLCNKKSAVPTVLLSFIFSPYLLSSLKTSSVTHHVISFGDCFPLAPICTIFTYLAVRLTSSRLICFIPTYLTVRLTPSRLICFIPTYLTVRLTSSRLICFIPTYLTVRLTPSRLICYISTLNCRLFSLR